MAIIGRDWVINGETLVKVSGNDVNFKTPLGKSNVELGLAEGPIRIRPRIVHRPIYADDYGPEVPAEVLYMLTDVTIDMTLIHYDYDILKRCIDESMGGTSVDGAMVGAGTPLGGGQPSTATGRAANNHYISLDLYSPVLSYPWRFQSAYLTGPAVEIPLGTHCSVTRVVWRAIPYNFPGNSIGTNGEVVSAGTSTWDHTLD
ncbi:MAG: hypothetical protein KGL39_12610 [Patescibacteria group bacterium]|nr:hypothetical protein [Patescibacteria group bacterium]